LSGAKIAGERSEQGRSERSEWGQFFLL